MKIFAVFIKPRHNNYGGDARYIDSQWAIYSKALERVESLQACFKGFGLEHVAWITPMTLADVEITQPLNPAPEKSKVEKKAKAA